MKKILRLLLSIACMTVTNIYPAQSTLSRVYSNRFIPEVQQYNNAGVLGTLNQEYGINGNLPLFPQVSNFQWTTTRDIVTLPDGSMYVLLDNVNESIVAMYSATGVLQTSFNGVGYIGLGGRQGAMFINLDGQGRIIAGGGIAETNNSGWMVQIDPNNPSAYRSFSQTTNFVGAFAQQTSGTYITVGLSAPYVVQEQSIPAYSQVIAFNQDGTINTSFGNAGYLVFDGASISDGNGGYLYSTVGIVSVAIDPNDNIYICYVDGTTGNANLVRFDADGNLSELLNNGDVIYSSNGNQILGNQIYVALDPSYQYIFFAGTNPGDKNIVAFGCVQAGNLHGYGYAGAYLTVADSLELADVVMLKNGYCALLMNDVTDNSIAIQQLYATNDQYDANFNSGSQYTGYATFQISSSPQGSAVCGGAAGVDGQLYLATSIGNPTPFTTSYPIPYISKMYDYSYVQEVAQYPATKLQGNFDTTFGNNSKQSIRGVDFLYNGTFGQTLNQQTSNIVELPGGDIVIGAYGSVQGNSHNAMMLNWLTPSGLFDSNFGNGSGQLTLNQDPSGYDEYMQQIAAGSSGTIYVVGESGTGDAFLRYYTSASTNGWTTGVAASSIVDEVDGLHNSTNAAGLAIQGSDGVLFFVDDPYNPELYPRGHISRYTFNDEGILILDTNFNAQGDSPGTILTNDFGLNMFPIWGGGLVHFEDNIIYIAYVSTDTGYVNAAAIKRDGSGLVSSFGDGGIAYNIFNYQDYVDPYSLSVFTSFDNQNNVIIGVTDYSNTMLLTRINNLTGNIDPQFNGGNILSVTWSPAQYLYLTGIVGVSNGKFMAIGINYTDSNPSMFTLRITDEGVLDTTFNPQGQYPGIVDFQFQDEENVTYFDRELTGLIIQSSSENLGNLVLSTYEMMERSPNTSIPQASRMYGQPRTTQVPRFPTQDQYPGTPNAYLNNCGAFDLNNFVQGAGAGKALYAYTADSDYDGMLLVGMDINGTQVQIVRFNASSLTLDPTFGNAGIYTIDTVVGLNNIFVDKDQRIVACGTMPVSSLTQGWALYVDKDGQNAPVFFNMPSSIVAANMVYQQKSGRFIIAGSYQNGSDAAFGTLIAFQDRLAGSATTLAVDGTFNPLYVGQVAGQWNIPTSIAGLYNLVITNDDTIYVAFQDSTNVFNVNQYAITIAKILADGSGYDQAFNGGGMLATQMIPDAPWVISCVADAEQNVIVAMSANNTLQLLRFAPSAAPYQFNPTQGSVPSLVAPYLGLYNILIVPSPLMGTAGVALTDMIATNIVPNAINGLVLLGTNTANGNLTNYGNLFAIRLLPNGDFDSTWNPYSGYPISSPNVPGVLTFGESFSGAATSVQTPLVQQWNGIIDVTGNLWTVGAAFNGYNNYPTLMEIVGYPYLAAIPQSQIEAPSGLQDSTLWNSGNNTAYPILDLGNFQIYNNVSNLYIAPNGSFYIGYTNNSNIVGISNINAPLSQAQNYRFEPANSGVAVINDVFVANGYAQNGAILSTGTINNAMWANVSNHPLPTMPGWTTGNAIRQAVNGDILVAGSNGQLGAICAFSFNRSLNNWQIDPLFGDGGVYLTTTDYPIADMAVDNSSRIYTVFLDSQSNNIIIQRIYANGSGIDTSFGQANEGAAYGAIFPAAVIDGYQSTQMYMALDQNNNQLVVAALDGGPSVGNGINVARFSTIDGSSTGVYRSITLGSGVNGAILDLLDVQINSDQQIYVMAYNSHNQPNGGGQTVVARFNSVNGKTIGLDTSYAVVGGIPGIAAVYVGMQTVAAALDPDRRVYVIGNQSEDCWLARLFGNNYYPAVPQSNDGVVLGALDYSYGYDGVTKPYAGGQTSGQIASTILPEPVGSNILVTVSNINGPQLTDSQGTWTVRLLSDGTVDSSYGEGQGVAVAALPGFEYTRNMIFDGYGNSIICGVNVGDSQAPVGFIKSILPSGAMNIAFGGQNGNPAGTVYLPQLFTVSSVAQLTTGNYVFAGADYNGNGYVGMLSSAGIPVVFGSQGYVTINNGEACSVVVDSQDNIYVAFGDYNGNASVIKLNAAGKRVKSFGVNGVAANVLTNIYNLEDIIYLDMALDASGNLVVTGTTAQNNSSVVNVVRVTPAGIIDTSFATAQSSYILSVPFIGNLAVPTCILALHNGNYLVAGIQGFDSNDTNDFEFIIAVTSNGTLDTNFNSLGATPGIGLYSGTVGSAYNRDALNISVQSNGQILLAGCEEALSGLFTPITMRINGYPNIQAVAQFPALASTPNNSPVNTQFGVNGYCVTGQIGDLMNGSPSAVDKIGNIIVGGITSAGQLVAARFLTSGQLDSDFADGGIAQVPVTNLQTSGNCYVAVDGENRVYLAGYTTTNNLVVVRFLANGQFDGEFGIATSNEIPNLNYGGYVAVDTLGYVVVAGQTSDFQMVVARFQPSGGVDGNFGGNAPLSIFGVATTGYLTSFNFYQGGFVAVDTTQAVYLGGTTNAGQLMCAKINSSGVTVDFVATTNTGSGAGSISGLIYQQGGSVALDTNLNIVVGGYTSNNQFVAARFTPVGDLDSLFNGNGIAYSFPLKNLNGFANLCVDSNNFVLLSGTTIASNSVDVSVVVARLAPSGIIDTGFTPTGLAVTVPLDGLALDSGFICVNQLSNPIVGGFDSITPQLVMAEFYSGSEIFIPNPTILAADPYKQYYYGNNQEFFQSFFAIDVYAQGIQDSVVRQAVIDGVTALFDLYAQYVINGPNASVPLVGCAGSVWGGNLRLLEAALILEHSGSTGDIQVFFNNLLQRLAALRKVMLTAGSN